MVDIEAERIAWCFVLKTTVLCIINFAIRVIAW